MKETIKIENVTVMIKKKRVINRLSCVLQAGEVVGLIGPNGAGKTTLMKTILGYIRPSSGEIIYGEGINYSRIGGLIEYPGLYPFMTGYEHLELFAEGSSQETMDSLIARFDLHSFVNQKSSSYSLGMKQRLGIALAFVNDPQVIIMDEPLNGLDPYSVQVLKQAIRDYSEQGTTFLISSHLLRELEDLISRILFLKTGKLMEDNLDVQEIANLSQVLTPKFDEVNRK